MADQQIGNPLGVTGISIGNGSTNKTNLNGGTGAPDLGLDIDNLDNISVAKTRLAAIDGTFYTAARMNTMSLNDIIFAIRTNDFASTIKQ